MVRVKTGWRIFLKNLGKDNFQNLLAKTIGNLDVEHAQKEVLPFVRNPEALEVWSREFFLAAVRRIRFVS